MPLRVGVIGVVVAVLIAGAVANPVDTLAVDPIVKLLIDLTAAIAGFVGVYAAWSAAQR